MPRIVGAVGHRSTSGHTSHLGRPGLQISLPKRIRPTCIATRISGGVIDPRMSCALAADDFGPIRPKRLATRWTCVSTGSAGRSSEKASTTAAVFGPTPGREGPVGHRAFGLAGFLREDGERDLRAIIRPLLRHFDVLKPPQQTVDGA